MNKKLLSVLLIIISGTLTGLSIFSMNYWLIWFALVPIFLVLPTKSIKESVFFGFIFGVVEGGILLFWIGEITAKFSGTETLLGIPLFLLLVLYYSLYPILFAVLFSLLKKQEYKKYLDGIIAALIAAMLWIITEWVRMNVLMGIPWVKDSLAVSQLKNVVGIQLISITGQWGVSLIIIMANVLFAFAIKRKKISYGGVALTLIALFYLSGFLMYSSSYSGDSKKLKVAIIQENINAETRWDETNGDKLATLFFDLNHQASSQNPDLIVWSESALPWIYSSDDELIDSVLSLTSESQAIHLIGMLKAAEKNTNKVYNSVFCINPQGDLIANYDKVNLLSFIEKPLISKELKIPFLSEGAYSNVLEGNSFETIKTKQASLGVLICNESLTPYEARKMVKQGADILINMSNDAWIENTHLMAQHFYVARMRAVETGKDLVINSNRGYGGHIDSRGQIIVKKLSKRANCAVSNVTVRPEKSFYLKYGDWIIYLSIIIITILFFLKMIKHTL